MRATVIGLGALLLLGASGSLAPGQHNPYAHPPPRTAPDACGPGWYNTNPFGAVYGPNHWLTPPFPPWNGALPGPNGGGQASPAFGTHPYARGPRDYFMVYDNWWDLTYPSYTSTWGFPTSVYNGGRELAPAPINGGREPVPGPINGGRDVVPKPLPPPGP
jgi:hypothetical protein